jgi:hypothetical protein
VGYDNNLLKKFGLQADPKLKKSDEKDSRTVNNMANPIYLRQSSALINDALKNGFDVLQLANGDIVTTGTKVVVTQYNWNAAKGKLVKVKPSAPQEKKSKPSVLEVKHSKETEPA